MVATFRGVVVPSTGLLFACSVNGLHLEWFVALLCSLDFQVIQFSNDGRGTSADAGCPTGSNRSC